MSSSGHSGIRGKDRGRNSAGRVTYSAPIPIQNLPLIQSDQPDSTMADQPSSRESSTTPTDRSQGSGMGSRRLLIQPNGDSFFPTVAVKKLSSIFKSKYEQPWTGWGKIPQNVRNMWFEEFRKQCIWEAEHDYEIKKIWNKKCAEIVRASLSDIRRGKSSGKWMSNGVLESLKSKWESDPDFKKLSDQNKKNISANPPCPHRGGAISVSERVRRVELELEREVSIPELFPKLNYDEAQNKWSNEKAKSTYVAYKKLKETKMTQGDEVIGDSTSFYEATGGKNKRGRSYGFGSKVAFYRSSGSGSGIKTSSNPLTSSQAKEVCDRLDVLEERNQYLESEVAKIRSLLLGDLKERNQYLESEVAKIRSLLKKLTGSTTPGHDTSTSRVSPSVPDNVEHHDMYDNVDVD